MSDQRTHIAMMEIQSLLHSIKDEGTEIDTGSGMGSADLWITSGGVEFFISVRLSNRQISKDASP